MKLSVHLISMILALMQIQLKIPLILVQVMVTDLRMGLIMLMVQGIWLEMHLEEISVIVVNVLVEVNYWFELGFL